MRTLRAPVLRQVPLEKVVSPAVHVEHVSIGGQVLSTPEQSIDPTRLYRGGVLDQGGHDESFSVGTQVKRRLLKSRTQNIGFPDNVVLAHPWTLGSAAHYVFSECREGLLDGAVGQWRECGNRFVGPPVCFIAGGLSNRVCVQFRDRELEIRIRLS